MIAPRLAVTLAALAGLTGVAAAGDLDGTYVIEKGRTPAGEKYGGKVTVDCDEGPYHIGSVQPCALTFERDDQLVYFGNGWWVGKHLWATWCDGLGCGVGMLKWGRNADRKLWELRGWASSTSILDGWVLDAQKKAGVMLGTFPILDGGDLVVSRPKKHKAMSLRWQTAHGVGLALDKKTMAFAWGNPEDPVGLVVYKIGKGGRLVGQVAASDQKGLGAETLRKE